MIWNDFSFLKMFKVSLISDIFFGLFISNGEKILCNGRIVIIAED